MNLSHSVFRQDILKNVSQEKPSPRELVDRSRVLTNVMLDRPDEAGPNFVMLIILADQLQMLHDVFEAEEVRQLSTENVLE